MSIWMRRIWRERLLLLQLVFFPVLWAANAAGIMEQTTGREIPVVWLGLCAFVVLGLTSLSRLALLHEQLDERAAKKLALREVERLLARGNEVLQQTGFRPDDMRGYTSPRGHGNGYLVWFREVASPMIDEFLQMAERQLTDIAPTYLGTFSNVGNIFANGRPARLLLLQRSLDHLQRIANDIRDNLR